MKIAIVALGASYTQYTDAVRLAGGRHALYDETWVINSLGGVLAHDRVFHMDDVVVQERRAEAGNSHVARMLDWLRRHPGPVYTSVARDGYPGLVAFPLSDVLRSVGDRRPYFNNTTAYAIALAIHEGVKEIALYGMDYTYPNRGHAEEGRACVEYWVGQAVARGIRVRVASRSTLLDTCRNDAQRLYGYDGVEVAIGPDYSVSLRPRDLPTAAEIEARYAQMHRG